jgi:UDP-glucose:glycoprotein glucosyltransferase
MSGDSPIVPWLLKGSVGTNAKRSLDYWTKAKNLVAKFGLKPGESGMVINGRVVGPFEPTAFVSPADFTGIKSYELEKRILPVMKALIASTFDFELLDR